MPFTTGKLVVDLPALDLFARRLDLIRNSLNSAPQNSDNTGDDLGDDRARDALEGFTKGWRDGRKKLDGELKALAEMGHSVVTELEKTDAQVAQAVQNGKSVPP